MEIVDYALPCMLAEAQIKKLHEAMLHRKHDEALEAATQAIVELRLTYNAIVHEKAADEDRRQSTNKQD
jgi:hypothetical protein